MRSADPRKLKVIYRGIHGTYLSLLTVTVLYARTQPDNATKLFSAFNALSSWSSLFEKGKLYYFQRKIISAMFT